MGISQTHFFATKKSKMLVFKLLLLSCSLVVPILGNNPKAFLEWYDNHKEGSVFPVPEVDCDWTLPDAGLVKKSYVVVCPTHCLNVNHCVRVKGSGPYAVNSPVCLAAIHAGVLDAQSGGGVEVSVTEGQKSYAGSVKHGVGAIAYSDYFASFTVKKSDVECNLEKKFISDLVSHFPIGPEQTRVGLITFNDVP